MITASVSVRVHRAELRTEMARASVKFVDRVTDALAIRSRELAPQSSGNLRRSIQDEPARLVKPTRATGRVIALSPYAVYQHEGTGVYGPRGSRIRPRRSRALHFFWKKVGALVFFRSVRGVRPTKFMVRAVDEVLSSPPWKITYFTPL